MSTDETALGHVPPHQAAAGHRPWAPWRGGLLASTRPDGGMSGFRGPLSRWPRAADAVLATVPVLLMVFLWEGPNDTVMTRPIADVSVLELVVYAVVGAALYWRRRAPLVGLGVVLAGWVVLLLGNEYSQLGFAAIFTLYSTGRYVAQARWGAIGIAVTSVLIAIDGSPDPAFSSWQETTFGGVVMFVAWYVGRRLRLRQQRAAQLVRQREAEARRIVAEERARIARELHDVVAHRVSLMTVQAGGAKAVAAEDPAAALQAMGAVEEAGRQALAELRHLLGVLRPATDNADDLGPQPGLADLPRLVGQIRQAGVDVALSTGQLPAELPARMDLFAYRIVQEALTNVLKHAGPGTRTEVRLRTDRGEVVIEVLDDGHGINGEPDLAQDGAAGHGIIGMRERALLLGGSLAAGPRPERGFQVVAHLPVGGETA